MECIDTEFLLDTFKGSIFQSMRVSDIVCDLSDKCSHSPSITKPICCSLTLFLNLKIYEKSILTVDFTYINSFPSITYINSFPSIPRMAILLCGELNFKLEKNIEINIFSKLVFLVLSFFLRS